MRVRHLKAIIWLVFICCISLIIIPISAQNTYTVITPENVQQLERVARLGRGYIRDIAFTDDHTLIIRNALYPDETWQYDTRRMDTPPLFTASDCAESFDCYAGNRPYGEEEAPPSIWQVSPTGITQTLSDDMLVAFTGERYVNDTLVTPDYLIIRRTRNRDVEASGTCTDDETNCEHQILVFDTRARRIIAEWFSDDILRIRLVLDDTHLAVVSSQSSDFYHLGNRGVAYNFTLPVSLDNFYDDYDLAMASPFGLEQVTIWNLHTRTEQLSVSFLPDERIGWAVLSEDGRYLTLGTTVEQAPADANLVIDYSQRNISVWDIQTGERIHLSEHFAPYFEITISPQGRFVAFFTQTPVFYNSPRDTAYFISLYDIASNTLITQIDNNLRNSASDMAFSADGSTLAISFWDGRVMLVDTATGDMLADTRAFPGYVDFINFTDGHIITGNLWGYSDWWDMDSLEHVRRDEGCPLVNINPVLNQGICHLYLDDFRNHVPASLTDLDTLATIPFENPELADNLYIHTAVRPDGQQMVTSSGFVDTLPIVWDAVNHTQLATLESPIPTTLIREVQYLADGAIIASRSHGVFWDADTYEVVAQLPVSLALNSLGVYSEAGDWVAFPISRPASDTTVYPTNLMVWRLSAVIAGSEPEPIAEITLPHRTGDMGAASPDGQLLIMGQSIVNMETFEVIHQLPIRGFEVEFSPDGRYIVVADGICLACGVDDSRQIGSAHVWAIP